MNQRNIDETLFIEQVVEELILVIGSTFSIESHKIVDSVSEISRCLATGGKVMWVGNGGSAAQSQHFAAELIGRLDVSRRPYASIALTCDGSALTCISNDFGFDQVFSRQVEGLGHAHDYLIAMSTSGSSVNMNAIRKARSMNIPCLFLTSTACDLADGDGLTIIRIQAKETARVQEVHGIIGHLLCSMIQSRLENFK